MSVGSILKGCLGFLGVLIGLFEAGIGLLEGLSGVLSGLFQAGLGQLVRYSGG